MRVHHLACGTMCPPLARRMVGASHLICHCLLVEHPAGLVLVDTGFGTAQADDPGRLPLGFRALARPRLTRAATALHQVAALGFRPHDVRHIVVTHLDLDHAGGLADFPWATLHVHADELAAATRPRGLRERVRYHATRVHDRAAISSYVTEGDRWLGLRALRPLDGLPDILLIPLAGHSRGHSGVAVRGQGRWLLHAGDAYFHRDELREPPRTPPGLDLFQRALGVDGAVRRANQRLLRELARDRRGEVTMFSAHDPAELAGFGQLAAAPLAGAGEAR